MFDFEKYKANNIKIQNDLNYLNSSVITAQTEL
jgi:hypothetical protein